jgi:ribosomal protein S18 acetylase RimI-like enzyme
MELAEAEVKARGARSLGLKVFGFNAAARSLYESLGYSTVSLLMTKQLR